MEEQGIIELLCSKGHRGSCTEEERWAANRIKGSFGEIGLPTELQEFRGHRTYGEKLLVHIVPALILSILVVFMQDLAVVFSMILLFFVLSFIIENIWFIESVSRFIPKGRSVNVLAREKNRKAKHRILFVAHHDSQKVGRIFDPKIIQAMKGYFSASSRITPIHLTFLAIVGLSITTAGFYGDLTGVLFVLLLLLHMGLVLCVTVSLYLVYEWTASQIYSPGANDNASGVAVMLGLAHALTERIKKDGAFENIEFWYLSTGCEETGTGGALAFIQEYSERLRNMPISVICLDGLGYGNLHYFIADGILLTKPYDPFLIKTAHTVMKKTLDADRPFICRVFTDGLAFSSRAFPTITFGSLDEENIVANYHWHTDTPENIDTRSLNEAKEFLQAYVENIASSVQRK